MSKIIFSGIRKSSTSILLILFFVFLLVTPVKFGTPAGIPEINIYPLNLISWIIYFWPPLIFTLLSSIMLLITILLVRKKDCIIPGNNPHFTLPLLWFILLLASLLGTIKSSCIDFAYLECIYLLGISAFAFAVFKLLETDSEKIFGYITGAIIFAAILISLYGIYQYFIGFNITRQIVFEAIKSKHLILPDNFHERLMDNIVFSTFSLSNSLAAYLILVIPVSVCVTMKYFRSRAESIISTLIVATILTLCLILTGSRAAILSLVLSLIIVCIIFVKNLRFKFFIIIPSAICTFLYFYFFSTKGISSIIIRLDYFYTSIQLLTSNWLTGAGWGSFFHDYPSMKVLMTTETPHMPHNFILSMGCQAGIPAMLSAIAILILPVFYAIRNIRGKKRNKDILIDYALLTGYLAWAIHSLMDIDIQIPGIVVTVIAITALIIYRQPEIEVNSKLYIKQIKPYWKILMLTTCLAGFYFSMLRIPGERTMHKLSNLCDPVYKIITINNYKYNPPDNHTVKVLLFKTAQLLPSSPFPWAIAGHYALRNKDYIFAEKCFKKAILLSPKRASFYYYSAVAQYKQGNKAKAYNSLKIAAELFPYKYKTILLDFQKQE